MTTDNSCCNSVLGSRVSVSSLSNPNDPASVPDVVLLIGSVAEYNVSEPPVIVRVLATEPSKIVSTPPWVIVRVLGTLTTDNLSDWVVSVESLSKLITSDPDIRRGREAVYSVLTSLIVIVFNYLKK